MFVFHENLFDNQFDNNYILFKLKQKVVERQNWCKFFMFIDDFVKFMEFPGRVYKWAPN